MSNRLVAGILGSFAVLLVALSAAAPAEAHGRRSSVFFGFNAYYPPHYYYPPPYYYAPAPVYYVPAPAYYPPPGATVPVQPPQPQPYCREYQGNATIDGTNQPFYGTACRQPDGTWRIVNQKQAQ